MCRMFFVAVAAGLLACAGAETGRSRALRGAPRPERRLHDTVTPIVERENESLVARMSEGPASLVVGAPGNASSRMDVSEMKPAETESAWYGSFCASKRTWGWFCCGSTRVKCCEHNGFWTVCQSVSAWHGCMRRMEDFEENATVSRREQAETQHGGTLENESLDATLPEGAINLVGGALWNATNGMDVNEMEIAETESAWYVSFRASKRTWGWFCCGSTRVKCCEHDGFWTACQSVSAWHGCMRRMEDLKENATASEREQAETQHGGWPENESVNATASEGPANLAGGALWNATNGMDVNDMEIAETESAWYGSFCASKRTWGWFCCGSTRVKCCEHDGFWTACQSVSAWHGCMRRMEDTKESATLSNSEVETQHAGLPENESIDATGSAGPANLAGGALANATSRLDVSELEIAETESAWYGSFCASKRTWGWFCCGSTRVKCCQHHGVWTACQSVSAWHGCMRRMENLKENATSSEREQAETRHGGWPDNESVNATASEGPANLAGGALWNATNGMDVNDMEMAETESAWYGSFCASKRTWGWFCCGSTRVKCCEHDGFWTACQSVSAWHGCMRRMEDIKENATLSNSEAETQHGGFPENESVDATGSAGPANLAGGALASATSGVDVSELETAETESAWYGSFCASKRTWGWFCCGSTRVKCCEHDGFWTACQSVSAWHGCMRRMEDLNGNATSSEREQAETQHGGWPKNASVNATASEGPANLAAGALWNAIHGMDVNEMEIAETESAWYGSFCASKRTWGWFCCGSTRVKCCEHDGFWTACQSVSAWHGCMRWMEDIKENATLSNSEAETQHAGLPANESVDATGSAGPANLAGGALGNATSRLDVSELETAETESAWYGSFCASKRTWGWFCCGSTRVKCCEHGGFWIACRSVSAWHGCMRRMEASGQTSTVFDNNVTDSRSSNATFPKFQSE